MNHCITSAPRTSAVMGHPWQARVVKQRLQRNTVVAASQPSSEIEPMSWKHVMVALIDSNPMLGTDSRLALSTAAGLALAEGKLTVVFFDETP